MKTQLTKEQSQHLIELGILKENEEWKDVVGYEGIYQVSNYGRVLSLERTVRCGSKGYKTIQPYLLKQFIRGDRNNRPYVHLQTNGKTKNVIVSRLVAQAFIPNPHNYPQVNHKDENPMNNYVDNLEWCSAEYNLTYNDGAKRRAKTRIENCGCRPILQLTKNNELVREWESARRASEELGIYMKSIYRVLCNARKTTGGYKWIYKD